MTELTKGNFRQGVDGEFTDHVCDICDQYGGPDAPGAAYRTRRLVDVWGKRVYLCAECYAHLPDESTHYLDNPGEDAL